MKKNQFSEAKIVEILALTGQDQSVDEICRTHNISTATFYNWRQKYGNRDTEELRRLKVLQAENARLKKLLADKSLDYDILNDAYELLKNRAARAAIGPTSRQVIMMVKTVVEQRKTSLRRVCRVVGQRRATVYAKPNRKNEDELISHQLKFLSMKYLNWAGPPVRICVDVWLVAAVGSHLES